MQYLARHKFSMTSSQSDISRSVEYILADPDVIEWRGPWPLSWRHRTRSYILWYFTHCHEPWILLSARTHPVESPFRIYRRCSRTTKIHAGSRNCRLTSATRSRTTASAWYPEDGTCLSTHTNSAPSRFTCRIGAKQVKGKSTLKITNMVRWIRL